MLRFAIPFINPLLLLTGFWLFFYNRSGFFWIAGILLLLILLSGRILSRKLFWKFKLLWLSLLMIYTAQFLFLLILTTGSARYVLSFVLAIVWGIVWQLIKRYFDSTENIQYRDYLLVIKFFYYLGFWFLSVSLYALVIFLHFPILYVFLILAVVVFLWSKYILSSYSILNLGHPILVTYLMAQLSIAVYLLPVSFYVMGSLLTLWFYFLLEKIITKQRRFGLYLLAFLLSFAIILATSIINY